MSRGSNSSPPAVKKSLQHRTISSAVAEELRRRIVDGAFKAGAQLRQDALATEFGVSRIPIREALVQLEAEGLVKIVPHRGAIVSELSMEEVEELFELRSVLEPRLLVASAEHLTKRDYQRLNDILRDYRSELRAGQIGRWGELNTQFHLMLYQHAGRPRMLAIVANLLQECDRLTRLQLALTGGTDRADREHAELLRLCEKGDIAAASTLLKEHIDNAGRSLRDYLEVHRHPDERGQDKTE